MIRHNVRNIFLTLVETNYQAWKICFKMLNVIKENANSLLLKKDLSFIKIR